MSEKLNTPLFTVFTPTFNRAHTLERVYKSLVAQTFKDFEWLVVDDGSTDGTQDLIKGWQQAADFPIVYLQQPNYGKHIAFNRGVSSARGSLFLPIDSDDAFLEHSLKTMLHWWELIPQNEREKFTGIVTLCQFEDGQICGDKFPAHPLDTNALELRYKYKKRGETWGFHRTEVLKQYPFPDDVSVRFIPENIVWDEIAKSYQIRCINEPLRVFYQDSGNQITKANPKKKARVKEYFLQMLNRDIQYFKYDPITFFKWSVLYVRYSLHAGDARFMRYSKFNQWSVFMLCAMSVLPGLLVYGIDKMRN